jgi:hypothetical protein
LSSSPKLSPSALATESAPPLTLPPPHLVNNYSIQSSLSAMHNYIQVKTPFNVDRFEAMLYNHPNQSFVKSVMRSLHEGFWPFDKGNWKDDHKKEAIKNYSSKEVDFEAIQAFQNDEIQARHWSDPLPIDILLAGMKLSPIFVIWQNGKPRVVTDHTASGLNDCIPQSEAKVRYDDMRIFGQAIFNAKRSHCDQDLITWKSDVSSASLTYQLIPFIN